MPRWGVEAEGVGGVFSLALPLQPQPSAREDECYSQRHRNRAKQRSDQVEPPIPIDQRQDGSCGEEQPRQDRPNYQHGDEGFDELAVGIVTHLRSIRLMSRSGHLR